MDEEQIGTTEKLILLKEQLLQYIKIAEKAAELIKSENISRYPIIVVHQDEIEIGIPLVERGSFDSIWSVNASTLEEFYTKKLVAETKLEDFKSLYKLHSDEICFFALSELGGQFLFMPRS